MGISKVEEDPGSITLSAIFQRPPFGLDVGNPLLDWLTANATSHHISAGSTLCSEGDPAHSIWAIEQGAFSVSVKNNQGDPIVVARVEAGTVIGESAVLHGATGVRNATLSALGDCRVWQIAIDEYLRKAPSHQLLRTGLENLNDARALERLHAISLAFGSKEFSSFTPMEHSVREGEIIFHEGDKADTVYVIRHGRVGLYRTHGQTPELLSVVGPGQCFGELGVLHEEPRSATARAETDVTFLMITGSFFSEAFERSSALRKLVGAMARVYEMPQRGFVTQLSGSIDLDPAIVTAFDLPNGERWVASRTLESKRYHLKRVEPPSCPHRTLTRESINQRRTIAVDENRRIVSIDVSGLWSELAIAQKMALEGIPVEEDRLGEFHQLGQLQKAPPGSNESTTLTCTCLNIPTTVLEDEIDLGCTTLDLLQKKTGCGTVCGGCLPRVKDLLGGEEMVLAQIVDRVNLSPKILRLRLRPSVGELQPFRAGQHLFLQGRIQGVWVKRPYTLTSDGSAADCYEVIISREPKGIFTSWIFDDQQTIQSLRVSSPTGSLTWIPDAIPTVCWVAGIGVTPAIAIARSARNASVGLSAQVHIDYSVRANKDAIGFDILKDACDVLPAFTLNLRVTQEEGRLESDDLLAIVSRLPEARHLVCGPESYISDVESGLRKVGVPLNQIFVERFEAVALNSQALPEMRTVGRRSHFPIDPDRVNVDRLERVRQAVINPDGGAVRHCPVKPSDVARIQTEGEMPGVYDSVGLIAPTYAEMQNIAQIEEAVRAYDVPPATHASAWRAILQSFEMAVDLSARLSVEITEGLDLGQIPAATDRMDWLNGVHGMICSLAQAGDRLSSVFKAHTPAHAHFSINDSPARARLATISPTLDTAVRRYFEGPADGSDHRLDTMIDRAFLCEAPARLDRAYCMLLERRRSWESALSKISVSVDGEISYRDFVSPDIIAGVLDTPTYDSSTFVNATRGLHLVPERLARETNDHLDAASSYLESLCGSTCSTRMENWQRSIQHLMVATALLEPMQTAILTMVDALSVSAYRKFRCNFGRMSATESTAIAEGLLHRAPERLGNAFARAIELRDGEDPHEAIARLPATEQFAADQFWQRTLDFRRDLSLWLDAHLLLPVIHLGVARSLAGKIDAVTSIRLKRRETLNRGWFGKLARSSDLPDEPLNELDSEKSYLYWRQRRLGDIQQAEAAHLADGHPIGEALERIAEVLRATERDERGVS